MHWRNAQRQHERQQAGAASRPSATEWLSRQVVSEREEMPWTIA
jgi:hypothetical protein